MDNPLHKARPQALLAAAACALVMSGLAGCSKPPGADLFPLDAGHRWTYHMATEFESGAVDAETVDLRNLGSDSLPNGAGSAMHRRSASGVDYWLRADDTGIWRVASKSDVIAEPELDPRDEDRRRYVLKRRNEFPPEIRHSHPKVPMNYAIDALDQKVDTRAGSFAGCVRVRGQATVKLFVDPVAGWQDLPLTQLEWFCPGVGLVRLERNEPANSTFLIGGKVTMDLSAWQ